MIGKRTFVLISFVVATLVACAEAKKGQTLRPYSGPRDAGVTEDGEDAATDAPVVIADAAVDTVEAAVVETYVSDLTFTEENGYGPVEKDMSNGENLAGDGVAMMIGGVPYAKGLGVHAPSKVTVALGGQYKTFLSDVGVDDEVAAEGSIVFRVVVDGVELYNSQLMTVDDAAKQAVVDVRGKNTLELIVDDGANGTGADHADWANARLRK